MDVLIVSDDLNAADEWQRAFAVVAPHVRVLRPGEASERVVAAIVDGPSHGQLAGLPRLRVVFAATAGVDDLLLDATLPNVPLVRLAPTEAVALMREYIIYHVIHCRRRFDRFAAAQQECLWSENTFPTALQACRVSVLGMGRFGRAAAVGLRDLGYAVSGLSRTPQTVPGIRCESGPDGLASVVKTADILVCLLPLTPETHKLLDAELFRQLPSGACVINAGRGACLHSKDLLEALDDGSLSHAVLDVFETEPLPTSSPLWTHPRVTLTPHIAATPRLSSLAWEAYDLLQTFLAGGHPAGLVDRVRGY